MRTIKPLLELLRDYHSKMDDSVGLLYLSREMWLKKEITYAEQMFLDYYLKSEAKSIAAEEAVLFSKSTHDDEKKQRVDFIDILIEDLEENEKSRH